MFGKAFVRKLCEYGIFGEFFGTSPELFAYIKERIFRNNQQRFIRLD
ncbi:hypothetical protein GWO43_29590 [candidate division KSB1 bacterium]|nr:hypothetical protein [candidate division KSB1 bacterium]NIR70157.1 hypothetical protein [candidate division KSB1 bacterium]NIS28069.1 hypothetical protein [candidate division KSB1 bacterium]NIT74938.1 hypothetical protein [candidate division KSB1 bacterium]NIU28722.1 hypothetical protein [candidate division KSB1 bacterium]